LYLNWLSILLFYISSQSTTTKSTKYTYERIVLTDKSGLHDENSVFMYDLVYNLTGELTVAASDHSGFAEFVINGDTK